MQTHGRHRKQRATVRAASTGRVAVSLATLGLGALQLGGVATAAPAAATVDGTSCTDARMKACVDLSENKTWLLDGEGNVVYGAVPNTHGSEGHETPTGDFVVQWKDRYHKSKEYDGASMPYSVFFDNNGRAFHQGSLQRESAGCVRLTRTTRSASSTTCSPTTGCRSSPDLPVPRDDEGPAARALRGPRALSSGAPAQHQRDGPADHDDGEHHEQPDGEPAAVVAARRRRRRLGGLGLVGRGLRAPGPRTPGIRSPGSPRRRARAS